MRYLRRGFVVVLLGLITAITSGADDLTTGSGKKFTGTLLAVDKDGVSFKLGDGTVKIAGKEIVLVDLGRRATVPAKDAKYQVVELTDGSRLFCTKFAIKKKALEIELLAAPKDTAAPALELPLASVFYVMRGAEDP